MVLDLVSLHIAHVVGVGGGNHDIAGGAVQVGDPLEEAGVVQRNYPDQLPVHHLDGGGVEHNLRAQSRTLAELFLCQLQCQFFVDDRDLGDVDGLHLAVKLFDLRFAQLIAVGLPLEENGGDCHDNDNQHPGQSDDDGWDFGELCVWRIGEVVELEVEFADLHQGAQSHIGGNQDSPEEGAIQIQRIEVGGFDKDIERDQHGND